MSRDSGYFIKFSKFVMRLRIHNDVLLTHKVSETYRGLIDEIDILNIVTDNYLGMKMFVDDWNKLTMYKTVDELVKNIYFSFEDVCR